MKILVTGAQGFIGKNLVVRLGELPGYEVLSFVRGDPSATLHCALKQADAVIHLAGENRPASPEAFEQVNVGLTQQICEGFRLVGRAVPLILASSTQAAMDNPYGRSKLLAEQIVEQSAREDGYPAAIFRLPGVFGKWAKPNYNSVVATFCYNKAHDLPVSISDANATVRLVYIDDLVTNFIELLKLGWSGLVRPVVRPEFAITLGQLSEQIDAFRNCRTTLISERVGTGLTRALYATYISFLPKDKFVYDVPVYSDPRGTFVEMLKTADSGQFSVFTAHPGVTRGGHYHHSKTEKFLVIKGQARFGFRHILTNETFYLQTGAGKPQVVETVPGWAHDITNVGDDELIVLLWANELFDRSTPDTIGSKVSL